MKRTPISKSTRFSVFERDCFTCQYCGKNPNDYNIVLEVDHVISVKDGGGNDIVNLVTACFDCNRGKGKKSVIKQDTSDINELEEHLSMVSERLDQIKHMKKLKQKIKDNEREIEDSKFSFIESMIGDCGWDELYHEVDKRIRNHHKKYDIQLTLYEKSLEITVNKFFDAGRFSIRKFLMYFHGVLRNLVEEEAKKW